VGRDRHQVVDTKASRQIELRGIIPFESGASASSATRAWRQVRIVGPLAVVGSSEQMSTNVKRGFNRLFIVLTVLWAGYCLFVFPIQMHSLRFELYLKMNQVCYDVNSANPILRKDCLAFNDKTYLNDISSWEWSNYYRNKWMYILAALVLVPLAVYGVCRAAGLVFVWVARGFRT